MKFCKHCGKEVKSDAKFCNHCGQSLQVSKQPDQEKTSDLGSHAQEEEEVRHKDNSLEEEKEKQPSELKQATADDEQTAEGEISATAHLNAEDDENKQTQSGSSTHKQSAPKKNIKKRNIYVFSGIGLIILLIGAYIMIDKMNSPTKLVQEFQTAVEEEDTEALTSILTTEHEDLEVNEDTVNAFIALYKSKNTEFKNIVSQLTYQAEGAESAYGSLPVELQKNGKKLLFFDDYQLVLLPVYLEVTTNYENTDIFVNGDKLATADEENFTGEVGPLTPGLHEVKAVYDTGFFHLDKEAEVEASDPTFAPYTDLYLDGDDVTFNLTSNRYDQLSSIKLLINGEETDFDLIQDDRVGPLLTDGSMNASFEAEFPWGTLTTDEVPIDDSYIDFNFGDNQEFRQELMDLIVKFNEEYTEVFANAKDDVFTTTTLPLQEVILEESSILKEEDIVYKGAFHGVDFYEESFELVKSYDDIWEVEVDTITYFEEDMFLAGDKEDLQQTEEEIRYELVFDPQLKEWVVGGLSYAGSMDEDKMERYKVDDPEMHTSDWDKKKKDKKD